MIITLHHWDRALMRCHAVSADTQKKIYSVKDHVYLTGSCSVTNYKATMKEVDSLVACCQAEGYKLVD